MAVQSHRFRTRVFRSICWVALGACFSPSQEEKRLVSFEGVLTPAARLDAGAGAGGGLDGGAAPADATLAAAPRADAQTASDAGAGVAPGIVDAGDGGKADPPVNLLFPSNCMAPWEETTKYHPDGYAAAKVHGPESNLNKDNCLSCHGAKLEGCANSPSCDNCHSGGHAEGWRKNCTYCHGGKDNDAGAPPRDIDGRSDVASLSFRAHTTHVTKDSTAAKQRHVAYDCSTCHKKPEDALDPGHMYDDTPEKAEVTFDGGLSKDGKYLGEEGCANLYCHGDVKTLKSVEHDAGPMDCKSCHLDMPTTGQHETHTPLVFWCSECHGDTVNDTPAIRGPDKHVNGKVDTAMPENNMQWNKKTCTGTCHVIVYHEGLEW